MNAARHSAVTQPTSHDDFNKTRSNLQGFTSPASSNVLSSSGFLQIKKPQEYVPVLEPQQQ